MCGLFPVVTFISMIFLPETPPWLVLHGRKEEAERVLKWLRGDNFDVSGELSALTAAQESSDNLKKMFWKKESTDMAGGA